MARRETRADGGRDRERGKLEINHKEKSLHLDTWLLIKSKSKHEALRHLIAC